MRARRRRRRRHLYRGARLARGAGRGRSPGPEADRGEHDRGGSDPVLPEAKLAELGFQLILYPLAGLYASAKALETVYATLRADGTTAAVADRLIAFERFNSLIGVDEKFALAERYGGDT